MHFLIYSCAQTQGKDTAFNWNHSNYQVTSSIASLSLQKLWYVVNFIHWQGQGIDYLTWFSKLLIVHFLTMRGWFAWGLLRHISALKIPSVIGPLHDPVTWYKITYTSEQIAHWDFQNNAPAFVLEVPLRNLLTSVFYFVPCDRVVQRVYYLQTTGTRGQ